MVQVGNEIYAIPQSMIEETLRISINDIKEVTGQKVLTIRDRVLPLFYLMIFLELPIIPILIGNMFLLHLWETENSVFPLNLCLVKKKLL